MANYFGMGLDLKITQDQKYLSRTKPVCTNWLQLKTKYLKVNWNKSNPSYFRKYKYMNMCNKSNSYFIFIFGSAVYVLCMERYGHRTSLWDKIRV